MSGTSKGRICGNGRQYCEGDGLDRIPTARVLQENEDGAIIEAEVFGDGIKMWIRSQGELISEVSYR